MNSETLSLRISKSEIAALRRRARAERVSQGTLVRRALRAYGITPEPEAEKSGFDVVAHLVGACRGGPSDLASNPRHLEGFGR